MINSSNTVPDQVIMDCRQNPNPEAKKAKHLQLYEKGLLQMTERKEKALKHAALRATEETKHKELTFKPSINPVDLKKPFHERLEEWQQKVKSKQSEAARKLREKLSRQEKSNCTFRPNITPKQKVQSQNKIVGTEQFLTRQEKARKMRQFKDYKMQNPTWYLWNHKREDDSMLSLRSSGVYLKGGARQEFSSVPESASKTKENSAEKGGEIV